ncbi:MAG: DUF6567 family protein [Syntrophales bacterium]|jgi:hypothetical protein
MKKIIAFVVLLLLAAQTVCCADGKFVEGYPRTDFNKTQPVLDLDKGNYAMLFPAVRGVSKGFRLFGFLPLTVPTFSMALNDLYKNIDVKGKATSLANVYQEESSAYFFFYGFKIITVTADVIELKTK